MAYLAFYRMFRPVSFDTVVRQEHIVRTLKNQIETDKIGRYARSEEHTSELQSH